jgi:lipoprotein signal peptidase
MAVLTANILVLDQAIKVAAERVAVPSLGGWFVPARNYQLSLGAGSGSPIVLAALALTAILVFGAYLKPLAFSGAIPVWIPGLLAGGAVSNLIDRFSRGAIQDWLATPWATVNLADLAVVAGVVALLISRWRAGDSTAAVASSWNVLERDWVRGLTDRALRTGAVPSFEPV